jgi:hypothetical protein
MTSGLRRRVLTDRRARRRRRPDRGGISQHLFLRLLLYEEVVAPLPDRRHVRLLPMPSAAAPLPGSGEPVARSCLGHRRRHVS